MLLPNSGLENHPDASGDLNALVNQNWATIDAMFSPSLGLTASQSGTTVTASGPVFVADDVTAGSKIRFANNHEVTITGYTNETTVTVSATATEGVQSFIIYAPGQTPFDAIVRGLTKKHRMTSADDALWMRWDDATKRFIMGHPIPSGTIMMWRGTIATIPAGFVLCNGLNGTPDLRNQFLVGAYADDGGAAKTTIENPSGPTYTATGGTLAHTHTVPNTGSQTDTLASGTDIADAGGAGDFDTQTQGHTHTVGNTGSTNNLPPYYAIAFIMKT